MRMLTLCLALALCTALAGCFIVPDRGWHHHWRDETTTVHARATG
jgi:hypothetical protein